MLVVDASVAWKWTFEEHLRDRALKLLESPQLLAAPELLLAEVMNIAWKNVRRGTYGQAQAAILLDALPIWIGRLEPLGSLVRQASEIAFRLDHPIYDCFYLALAEREAVPLVTADKRLLGRVAGTPWARSVVDLAGFAP
jgi:predicted nucleic acid-binding protein